MIRQGAAPIPLMIGQAPDFCFLAWDWWSSVVFFLLSLVIGGALSVFVFSLMIG